MICCFGVAYSSALRISMSPRTGLTLFGSVNSLFWAVFISIRSTLGPGTVCSVRPLIFSRSTACAAVRFQTAFASPALSWAIATSTDGTLRKITLSRYGFSGAKR